MSFQSKSKSKSKSKSHEIPILGLGLTLDHIGGRCEYKHPPDHKKARQQCGLQAGKHKRCYKHREADGSQAKGGGSGGPSGTKYYPIRTTNENFYYMCNYDPGNQYNHAEESHKVWDKFRIQSIVVNGEDGLLQTQVVSPYYDQYLIQKGNQMVTFRVKIISNTSYLLIFRKIKYTIVDQKNPPQYTRPLVLSQPEKAIVYSITVRGF